jgi:hypothetical protein
VFVLLAAVLAAPAVHTQSKITPPQFTAGGKTYTAATLLWRTTRSRSRTRQYDQESDRVNVVDPAKTAEAGRC